MKNNENTKKIKTLKNKNIYVPLSKSYLKNTLKHKNVQTKASSKQFCGPTCNSQSDGLQTTSLGQQFCGGTSRYFDLAKHQTNKKHWQCLQQPKLALANPLTMCSFI